ncbi:MAG: DUF2254 domain-containing protein [Solirubrobacteraceae bacterium]
MSWQQSIRVRQYVRESLWLVPALALVAGAGLGVLDVALVEPNIHLPHGLQYSAGTASTILAGVISAMVGLTGIVVAVAVLIIQMATGTLSPRYMRIWYRDPLQKAALAGFLGTLGFAYALLRRTLGGPTVPDLGVTLTGLAVVVAMILFLLYFNRFARLLRPVGVCAHVAQAGLKAQSALWEGLEAAGVGMIDPADWPGSAHSSQASAQEVVAIRAGVVQAIDYHALLALATRHEGMIVLEAGIGDFVPAGDALAQVIGAPAPGPVDHVREAFLLGTERAFEHDAAFALRIIVDVAIRALSPGINDPTTGVQALDYVERMLRPMSARMLAPSYALHDPDGRARVLFDSRTWEDFLALGLTEIREYGSTSTQVTRRLRALLEGLMRSADPGNRAAIESQLAQLDAILEEDVSDPVRRAYASIADRQGLGGRDGARAASNRPARGR